MITGQRSDSVSSDDRSADESVSKASSKAKKVCRVCGDKAFSVNFNVVTCESCKAFFRRNALKPKEFRCPFNGCCEINAITRRQCKKCRLEKCFQVGMVKDFIMSDEARMRKRHLVEENRAKRRLVIEQKMLHNSQPNAQVRVKREYADNSEPHCSFDRNSAGGFQIGAYPLTADNISRMGLTNSSADTIKVPKSVLTALINQCHKMLPDTSCPHSWTDGSGAGPSSKASSKIPMNCSCRCFCGSAPNWSFFKSEHNSDTSSSDDEEAPDDTTVALRRPADPAETVAVSHRDLLNLLYGSVGLNWETGDGFVTRFDYGISASKFTHLDNLKYSFEVLYDQWQDGYGPGQCHALAAVQQPDNEPDAEFRVSLPTLVQQYDNIVRRLVKMCRRIFPLKYLSVKDQISLIKGSLEELMMLRSMHAYMPEMDCWRHYDVFDVPTPVKILKFKGEHVYRSYVNFMNSFPRTYITDEKIFLTMVAMILFSPDRPSIIDKDAVRLIRSFYQNMLLQYLTSTHGDETGKKILSDVIKIVENARAISGDIVWRVVLELDSRGTEPLLIDIFNYQL